MLSYTPEEFRQIMTVARREARTTAARIREHRQLLDRWRLGGVDQDNDLDRWELGRVLDRVEATGDVPRVRASSGRQYMPRALSRCLPVRELITMVHLTWREAMPFVVLPVGPTGLDRQCLASFPSCELITSPGAGRQVVLHARNLPTTPWYAVATTTSDANGLFQMRVNAPGTRQYRVLVLGVPWPNAQHGCAKAGAMTAPVASTTVTRVVSARFTDPLRTAARRSPPPFASYPQELNERHCNAGPAPTGST